MKLNLRKARKLEKKIRTFLNAMDLDAEKKFSLADDCETIHMKIDNECADYAARVCQAQGLNRIIYAIRERINEKNYKNGISKLMLDMKHLEADLNMLGKIDTGTTQPSIGEIELSVNAAKSALSDTSSYRSRSTKVKLCVLGEVFARGTKLAITILTKEIEDLEDKIAKKNLSSTIKLDEDEVSILTGFNIL